MSDDLREWQQQPYELLKRMEQQLRRAEGIAGGAETWTGLGFEIAGDAYVAPRAEVAEILPPPGYTRIPNAQPWLLGLANVRGSLEAVIDTRRLLFGQPTSIGENTRLLVLQSGEVPAGFLVDSVTGFLRFGPHEQRHDQATAETDEAVHPYLLGAFVREGHTLPVFSLAKLADSSSFQQAAA